MSKQWVLVVVEQKAYRMDSKPKQTKHYPYW